MSSPTRNRPHKGRVSPRAIKTWKDAFHGFVLSSPDSTLPTTNLPPNQNRNMFSLGSSLRRNPASALVIVEGYELDGSQLSFENLRNYSSTVYAISQDRVSHDAFALIEHL
jgi:hypothetical protein